jgi:predicted transcriptional regulator
MNTPGLYSREMSRQLKITRSTLRYHLNCLEKQGLITKEREGKYLHYYGADTMDLKEKKILSVLRKSTARQIVLFLLIHVHSSQVDLSRHLEERPTTIVFYLKKLLELDIITPVIVSDEKRDNTILTKMFDGNPDGNEIIYMLKDVEFIDALMRKYTDGLFH